MINPTTYAYSPCMKNTNPKKTGHWCLFLTRKKQLVWSPCRGVEDTISARRQSTERVHKGIVLCVTLFKDGKCPLIEGAEVFENVADSAICARLFEDITEINLNVAERISSKRNLETLIWTCAL